MGGTGRLDETPAGLDGKVGIVKGVNWWQGYTQDTSDDEVREAFDVFLQGVPEDGHIVACADSPELMRIVQARRSRVGGPEIVTYGRAEGADCRVTALPGDDGGAEVGIHLLAQPPVRLHLRVPGAHNALNGAAAWLAACRCGVEGALAADGDEPRAGSRGQGVERGHGGSLRPSLSA